ncbi:MAG: hypothetical protein ABI831_10105 [Betaproteobacteria bacterium]
MRTPLLSFLAASLLCACATTAETNNAPPKEEKNYVTGSNIPRKDSAGSYGVESVSKAALEAQQRASGGPVSRGGDVPRY